jgi:SNF2 family DNA or RNA helicase
MRELMKQQKKALEYASPLARIALFMEMRLGKTTTVIRWKELNKDFKRCLVLCPDDVKDSWKKEFRAEYIADEDVVDVAGTSEKRIVLATGPGEWFLSTYQAILYCPEVLDLQWDGIILDESTTIRNPQAQITKLLYKRRDNFKYRAVLSGLPNPESDLDYFEQMRFVWDSFMGCHDYWSFRRRYFHQFGYDWKCSKLTKEKIMEAVGALAFVMTRKQAGIGSKKLRTTLTVDMDPLQVNMINDIRQGFEFKAVEGVDKDYGEDTKWIPVKYLWEGIIAGGFSPHGHILSASKVKLLKKLLKGELKNEKKVVVWCRYTHEIRFVAAELTREGIKTAILIGQDKSQKNEFTDGSARVICAQARCGRYGLDWSCSSTAIYYSNWYDGEIRQQSEDRIIHPKKKEPVLYIDLVTKGTIDEDVVEMLKQKKLTSRKFLEELARRRNETSVHN